MFFVSIAILILAALKEKLLNNFKLEIFMSFYLHANKIINKVIRNYRLDISGEVNVLSTDMTKAIMIDDDLYNKVSSAVSTMKKDYPYIEISISRELHELAINFFSINELLIFEDNYFENFQSNISKMVNNIVTTDALKVRINFFGTLKSWPKLEKFIMVNNDKDIYFKITEAIPRGFVFIKFGELVEDFLLKHMSEFIDKY